MVAVYFHMNTCNIQVFEASWKKKIIVLRHLNLFLSAWAAYSYTLFKTMKILGKTLYFEHKQQATITIGFCPGA